MVNFSFKKFYLHILTLCISISVISVAYSFKVIPTIPLYSRYGTAGIMHHKAVPFIENYFLTGIYPIVNKKDGSFNSNILEVISTQPENLTDEYGIYIRLGEHTKLHLYRFSRLFIDEITIVPANIAIWIFLTLSIYTLFYFSVWKKYAALIAYLCVFNPFIYQAVFQNNIFYLTPLLCLAVFGLFLFSIHQSRTKWQYFKMFGIACVFGMFLEIRTELQIVIYSIFFLALFYVFFSNERLKVVLQSVIIISGLYLGLYGVRSLNDTYISNSKIAIESLGGKVYNGPKIEEHRLWHNTWCGLGDFDSKYGYVWDDMAAIRYAVPLLNEKGYNLEFNPPDSTYKLYSHTYSQDGYPIAVDLMDDYQNILRNNVISTIKGDPIWFVEILVKRILKLITDSAPILGINWILIGIVLFNIKRVSKLDIGLLMSSAVAYGPFLLIYSNGHVGQSVPFCILLLAFVCVQIYQNRSLKFKLEDA